jgi:hypothetical protein
VSRELRDRLTLRAARLRDDVSGLAVLRDTDPPTQHHLAAMAWLIAAAYTEMEEFLKGVAQVHGERLETGSWHRSLLEVMARATASRPAVVSEELCTAMEPFLAFRHFSRHSTFPDLDWAKMQPLVEALPSVSESFIAAAEEFLDATEGGADGAC